MTSGTTTEILALGKRWAEVEQSADTAVLDDIAVDELRLVGPLGHIFVRGADSGWRIANIQLSQLAGPPN
jgi:hypothetical protein